MGGSWLNNVGHGIQKHSPTIFTGLAVAGVISTAILASKDTLHARELLIEEFGTDDISQIPKQEVVSITWKCYIPTIISVVLTAGCCIGSNVCNAKQKGVLLSSYLGSQAFLQEYQRKVIEQMGPKKEERTRSEAIKEIVHKEAPMAMINKESKEATQTGHGNSLIYDSVAKEYFRSDVNFIKEVRNELNNRLISGYEMSYTMNDIRQYLGLDRIPLGDLSGIDAEHLLSITFIPELMDNNDVRIIISYNLEPLASLSESNGKVNR